MKKNSPLIALLLWACSFYASAEKAPITFGKVSMDEMEMKVYEQDTSASAVILCKYGYFSSNNLNFTRIERTKVLKKNGVAYAETIIPGGPDVTFRGKTYNLENGKIVEEKLKKESIFREQVYDNYFRYRIALPNVKEGSVFELESTSPGLPSEWTFQSTIPVKYCELILEDSQYINFRKRMVGFESLSVSSGNRFVSEYMPAFKTEAFMNSKENYISKMEFDILNISIPGYYKSYTTTWEAVNEQLMNHTYFGGTLKGGSGYLSDIQKEIEALNLPALEKTKKAYDAIKQIKWNEESRLYSTNTSLAPVFKKGSGNSADINFMLLQLLKRLDIQSYPIVMSTRSNGMLSPFFPSYEKLDYVLVCAELDGNKYVLDATEQEMPFEMLPFRCLNGQGRLVTEKGEGEWIEFNPKFAYKSTTLYELNLNDDLSLEGMMKNSKDGYAAFEFRKAYKKYAGEDDYLTSMEAENPGMSVKNFTIKNLDSLDFAVQDAYDVKIKNKVERINDMVIINPFLYEQETENPFKLEERKYPVDFGYKTSNQYITIISFPEKYEVSELPKPCTITTPDQSMQVKIIHQLQGNKLTTVYRMLINKPIFLPDEYATLKGVYEQIIKKHAEPIILKTKSNVSNS